MIVTVKENVLGVALVVCVGDVDKLRRTVRGRHGANAAREIMAEDDEQAFTWLACTKKGYLYAYVWLRDLRFTPASEGVMVHELVHVVTRILEDRGVDDDETRAYLSQFYWTKAMTKIRKATEKEQ